MSKFFTLISCLAISFLMRANAADNQPPIVVNLIPSAGSTVRSLTQIEVFFSEDVTGVDAADLLINGVAADSVDVFTAAQYVFNFQQPPAGVVQVAWSAGHAIQHTVSATAHLVDHTGSGFTDACSSSSRLDSFALDVIGTR